MLSIRTMKELLKLLLRTVTLSGDISALSQQAKAIQVLHNSPLFMLKVIIKTFNFKCETKNTSKALMMRKRRRKGWVTTVMMNKLLNMTNHLFCRVLAALSSNSLSM